MKSSNTKRVRARFSTRARNGFSLIEVMVAMTMLSLVLLQLAKVTTALALKNRTNDLVAKRTASLQLEANKFGAVPWASLATWSVTDQTITRGNFTYTRHLVITKTGINRYSVKIVVTPSADATKKDSVMIDRTQPPASLCKGC
jgi:prepilin-type N-terminal cleavage/methylation domain-containing protein